MTDLYLRDGTVFNLREKLPSGLARYTSDVTEMSSRRRTVMMRNHCYRCDGKGQRSCLLATGLECFKCRRKGYTRITATILYTIEQLNKLNENRVRRLANAAMKKEAERAALAELQAFEAGAKRDALQVLYPDAVAYLDTYKSDHPFISSVKAKLARGVRSDDAH